ncbi:rubrerythrin [Rhodoblastus sphagnicola]|uniref:Rubrerythrin n=1 Tax=Rhodoblastus sphagnicola TaxID=333368 RepID=A0A2S6MVX2_9HYPH|nr:ferritin family protein [Rhodoblastus sphagnicola]PPQ26502.1 rubrerythrin [Rhodoblastus sphagnicola]
MKKFAELTEREILAIAIASEEEDSRIYVSFSEELAERYPATSKVFAEMAEEEDGHRRQLLEIYQARFGQNLPAIRREDVTGYYSRRPTWLMTNLPLETIRGQAEAMEKDAQRFYVQAAKASQDVGVRKLLGDLALVERSHGEKASALSEAILTESAREAEGHTAQKFFVLQYIQPGLAGLMDGSVSTLAPLFAAAFATHTNFSTLLVGLAASLGAGISMGFAEALSDDGAITGRGAPLIRGVVCGLMTTLGGLGHALPYLVPDSWPNAFWTATAIAGVVVFVELWLIAYIRARYMDTPFLKAVAQIVVGGVVVLFTGILIGGA